MIVLDKKDLKLISDQKIKLSYDMPYNKEIYMYNSEYYILKGSGRSIYSDFNELFSSFLSSSFNVNNAEYLYIKDNYKYTLASKNFKDINNNYFYLWDVLKATNIYEFNNKNSLDRIVAFKGLYSSEEKYNKFIESILNLIAFDFYTHQTDRSYYNVTFMKQKGTGLIDFTLAPIYDNECSFQSIYDKNIQVNNSFYQGKISNITFLKLLNKYSSGLEAFKSILDINIDEQLKLFQTEYSNTPICDEKKNTIKEIDEEAKNLVLKYIK